MIKVTFNSADAYLIDEVPNWENPFSVEASIPVSYERGLTGLETRRAQANTLRLNCNYEIILQSSAKVTAFRNALESLTTEYVLVPFWAFGFAGGTSGSTVTASNYAVFNLDGSFDSIGAASTDHSKINYPLMVGILPTRPTVELLDNGNASVKIEFKEDSSYSLTFSTKFTSSFSNGAANGSGSRPIFPYIPNWEDTHESGAVELDIERRQIGMQRSMSASYYAQAGRRIVNQDFTLTGTDQFTFLRLFLNYGNERYNFWLGASLAEANLTADAAVGANTISVDNYQAIPLTALNPASSNNCIILTSYTARQPFCVQSASQTSGTNGTWTLGSNLTSAFKAGQTAIESLILARFDVNSLKIDYIAPRILSWTTVNGAETQDTAAGLASCKVQFKEVPWETNGATNETIGTTMGALPITAILFKFTTTTPSGSTSQYLTSYESDLTDGTNTWLSAPMEFNEIQETADLKRNEVTIQSRNFSGNPLAQLFPMALEWPLMIEIYEADVSTNGVAYNLREYFYGEVGSADFEPPFITAQCSTLSHIFDRNIPRRLYQVTDNWVLFEPANGLNTADWAWTANVVSYDSTSSALTLNTVNSTNPATLTANYFSSGYLVLTTASGAKYVRMIAQNSALTAGQITLSLATEILNYTANQGGTDTVVMYPGYDGLASTAQNKFNNYSNFGGFPFMPVGNPSTLRITSPTGGGKK